MTPDRETFPWLTYLGAVVMVLGLLVIIYVDPPAGVVFGWLLITVGLSAFGHDKGTQS